MISPEMAKTLAVAIDRENKLPSAFQIRLAGIKGMLVVNPELNDASLKFRPSMEKFKSDSTELDILKVSEPRPVYLNRPLITIMEQLGIHGSVFLSLQLKHFQVLVTAFDCDDKCLETIQNHSTLPLNFDILKKSEVNLLGDPFFDKVLSVIIKKSITDLKAKARILIPFEQGRIMYGVLDETKTLDYGEVFVQYSDKNSKTSKIVEGTVVITKYPCMHSGDVRKFNAVNVSALHHIKDCVVFPARGSRPHPDEMAGSDLDGDEYSVFWHESLIFPRENCAPMIFPYLDALNLSRTVEMKDILDFYSDFIINNQVGQIASAELSLADQLKCGIFHETCKILNFKYAVALDYAKTNRNIKLSSCEKPAYYPDFMCKSGDKPTYRSKRTLGHLYRQCCRFEKLVNDISLKSKLKINDGLRHPEWRKYELKASEALLAYKLSVSKLLRQFGIDSETDLLTGCYTSTSKYLSTKNENNNIQDLLANSVKELFQAFRQRFNNDVGKEEDKAVLASAWYMVSYDDSKNGKETFYGLPWIVSEHLVQNAKKPNRQQTNFINEIASKVKSANFEGDVEKYFVVWRKEINKHLFREDHCFVKKYLKEVYCNAKSKIAKKDGMTENAKFIDTLVCVFDELVENVKERKYTQMENRPEVVYALGLHGLIARHKLARSKSFRSLMPETEDAASNFEARTNLIALNNPDFLNFIDNPKNMEKLKKELEQKTKVKQISCRKTKNHLFVTAFGTAAQLERMYFELTNEHFCGYVANGCFFHAHKKSENIS